MNRYFARFFESDNAPSIRLACGFLVVVLACGLQVRFATRANVQAMLEADFVFASSLFAIGSARLALQSFAARPPEPPAQIKAETAKVEVAGDANFQGQQPE